MLYRLSDFRPHSSPDPLTRATLPPGEGIFIAPLGRRAYFFDTGAKLWYYGIQNALPTNFGPNFKAGKDRHYA